ncbi:MAG: ATP-binding protein [Coriobacteriia bacterium]|nr:ATP-binding protein [Coriobacteriia bacterium]
MKRHALDDLSLWKQNPRRKPLLLTGARQVGKTWLMKEFGDSAYQNTAYIDFTKNERMRTLFSGNISPDALLPELELYMGHAIEPGKTLLIFDEVQEVPRALTSLKYFNEQAPEYHLMCAGSHMGIALHQGTSFPVGQVNTLRLYPLTFYEYLQAVGEDRFIAPLQDLSLLSMKAFNSTLHDYLKRYFLVGGMPEVVAAYAARQDFAEVRSLQEAIFETYDNDLSKHAPAKEVPRIRWLLDSIPRQLAKENKKFVYGQIKKGARGRDYELGIMWLHDIGIVYRANNLTQATYPLKMFEDPTAFKLFLHDVGLLSCHSGIDERILLDGTELFDKSKGALTEQYVAQELTATWPSDLYYWSNSAGNAELDFVIQSAPPAGVLPIEVKPGINLKAKSLKVFQEKFSPAVSIRFSLADYKVNHNKDGSITIDVPLYAVESLPALLERVIADEDISNV